MDHQRPRLVSISSDDDETVAPAAAQTEVTTAHTSGEAEEATTNELFAERRRHFLHGTASTLMRTRVHAVQELQVIVKDLVATIAKMKDMRDTIERADELLASLSRYLEEDLRGAEAFIAKYSFTGGAERASPFAEELANVASMFMVDMSDAQ
jgi:hypothetical protein